MTSAPGPARFATRPARALVRWLADYVDALSPTGLVLALLAFCQSMTPSLIPRTWWVQAVVTGLSVIGGYALGATLGWLTRLLAPWFRRRGRAAKHDGAQRGVARRRVAPRVRLGIGIAALVAVPIFVALGARWQNELRSLFGVTDPDPGLGLIVVLLAIAVAGLLLALGRAIRRLVRRIARFLGRWVPAIAGHALAIVALVLAAVLIINGTVLEGAVAVSQKILQAQDASVESSITVPTAPERSGSPESLVPWDTLGDRGRAFVAHGRNPHRVPDPSVLNLSMEPIRIYVGLRSADTLTERVQLAMDELDRTDAWDRSVLVIATPTSSGWISPSLEDAVELAYDGDSAIVGLQYLQLPSWAGQLTKPDAAVESSQALFDAIHAEWLTKPADHRPQLVVTGESLGAEGSQGIYPSWQDFRHEDAAAIWVGTPNETPLWSTSTEQRDAGSPEYSPILDQGATVRWDTGSGSDLDRSGLDTEWAQPRAIYIQHASDPVVWWSPSLLWSEPDWLKEPPGPDVLPSLTWMPWVTFCQVTFDLLLADSPSQHHGHRYSSEYVTALGAVAPPPGWTAEKSKAIAVAVDGLAH